MNARRFCSFTHAAPRAGLLSVWRVVLVAILPRPRVARGNLLGDCPASSRVRQPNNCKGLASKGCSPAWAVPILSAATTPPRPPHARARAHLPFPLSRPQPTITTTITSASASGLTVTETTTEATAAPALTVAPPLSAKKKGKPDYFYFRPEVRAPVDACCVALVHMLLVLTKPCRATPRHATPRHATPCDAMRRQGSPGSVRSLFGMPPCPDARLCVAVRSLGGECLRYVCARRPRPTPAVHRMPCASVRTRFAFRSSGEKEREHERAREREGRAGGLTCFSRGLCRCLVQGTATPCVSATPSRFRVL